MSGKGGSMRRQTLTLTIDDGVASLTLDRADRLNAMNLAMRRDLQAAFADLTAEPPDALIITGSGRAFCVGGDIDEFATRTPRRSTRGHGADQSHMVPELVAAAVPSHRRGKWRRRRRRPVDGTRRRYCLRIAVRAVQL
jgi:enoyl-CoA hydratase/carnithine racemase